MEKSSDNSPGLLKQTLIYSIGSFGSKILSFLLIPFYTFFLSKSEIGEFDLLFTTVSLFVPLVSLQMSDAVYRWLIEEDKTVEIRSKIISNSLLGFCGFYVLFTFSVLIYHLFYPIKYIGFFLLLLFFNCLLPILQNILRGNGEVKKFAYNGIVTSFLLVLFNIIFLNVFKLKVDGVLLANIVSFAIASLLIGFQVNLKTFISFKSLDIKIFTDFCKYSLPLIPNLMSWWLISSASKFIILKYLGADQNGLYAIASRFPSILVIINSVLILPIQDSFLKNNSKMFDFKQVVDKFLTIEFSLIILLITSAPIYMKYIVDGEFYESWIYMSFLYLGVGMNTIGALIGLIYQKSKNTKKITYSTILGAIFSLTISFLLVEEFKLMGISISFFLGYAFVLIFRMIDLRNYFWHKKFVFNLLGMITLCLIFTCLSVKINYTNQIFLFIFALILTLFLNKEKITNIIKNVFFKIR